MKRRTLLVADGATRTMKDLRRSWLFHDSEKRGKTLSAFDEDVPLGSDSEDSRWCSGESACLRRLPSVSYAMHEQTRGYIIPQSLFYLASQYLIKTCVARDVNQPYCGTVPPRYDTNRPGLRAYELPTMQRYDS